MMPGTRQTRFLNSLALLNHAQWPGIGMAHDFESSEGGPPSAHLVRQPFAQASIECRDSVLECVRFIAALFTKKAVFVSHRSCQINTWQENIPADFDSAASRGQGGDESRALQDAAAHFTVFIP